MISQTVAIIAPVVAPIASSMILHLLAMLVIPTIASSMTLMIILRGPARPGPIDLTP